MRIIAPALALFLAGCWQAAIVGEPGLGTTSGGGSSSGGKPTGTGTGHSTGGSSGGKSSSGTGGGPQCGRCAAGATCDGGVCVCPGAKDGTVCPYNQIEEKFCSGPTCASCEGYGEQAGDHCLLSLEVGDPSPACIASDSTNVYWTDANGIKKVPITDIMKAPTKSPQSLFLSQSGFLCLAIDETNVYFTIIDQGAGMEVPLDGGTAIPLASNQEDPNGIAVDRQHIFWTDTTGNKVMRLQKTAAPNTPVVIADLGALDGGMRPFGGGPYGIAIDSNYVYWTNNSGGQVMMVSIDGGTPTVIADGQEAPLGIAVDATNVYWTNQYGGEVYQQLLAGPFDGGTLTLLASNQAGPTGIAVDSNFVYWTNKFGESVNFVPINGGQVAPVSPVPTNASYEIAVDSKNIYWTTSSNTDGFVYELTPK